MKQRIFLSGILLAVLSLAVFGFINKEEKKPEPVKQVDATQFESYFNDLFYNDQGVSDFAYDVGNRFIHSVSKEALINAKTVTDIIVPNDEETIISYHNIYINTHHESSSPYDAKRGENERLTVAQIGLLQTLGYGDNFYINGIMKRAESKSGKLYDDQLVYYLTVVPHRTASYVQGKAALISYLKENSKEVITIARKDQLKSGKISFTITEDGTIGQAELSTV